MIKYNLAGEMTAEFQLCEGRHECPVEDSIFGNTVAVMAFGKMELEAHNILAPLKAQGLQRLVIYVTGCTSALVAVLNAATKLQIRQVELKHWDSVNNGYQSQFAATLNDIYVEHTA